MESLSNKNSIIHIKEFFYKNGWEPLPYQIESWEAYLNGKNGIIQVPTGCGKTYAALMGPLSKLKDSTKRSGLNNTEIKELDRWIRQNTIERFGPVRSVKPEMVFEISFENIQTSKRHKSGIAVRFPRITKWRKDKLIKDADTLENAEKLMLNK